MAEDAAFERKENFSTDAQVDKDGVATLSKDIQDEQAAQGFVPDVQPKSVGTPVPEPVFDPTKTQATGNVVVAHASNASVEAEVAATTALPKLGSK